jgi:AcrR family transcriptional regulator
MPRPTVRPVRREQILDAADRLLRERGWSDLTLAALCRAAAVSNGVLTYHFRDKDDLLFALLERAMARMRERSLLPFVIGEAPLRERLTTLVGSMPDHGAERREFRLLMLHFLGLSVDRPDVAEQFRALYAAWLADLTARFAKDAAEGTIVRDPAMAAEMTIGVLAGFGLIHKLTGVEPPRDEMVELLDGYLTRGHDEASSPTPAPLSRR